MKRLDVNQYMREPGQVIVGRLLSLTLTLNVHVLVKVPKSVAVHPTVVIPNGNLYPLV